MARGKQPTEIHVPTQPQDKPYNAADPEQVAIRRKQALRRKAEAEDVVKSLLATVAGRRWLWSRLEFCHVHTISYDPQSDRNTAFREGERNVGNMLLAEIMHADSNGYVRMLKEFGAKQGEA